MISKSDLVTHLNNGNIITTTAIATSVSIAKYKKSFFGTSHPNVNVSATTYDINQYF